MTAWSMLPHGTHIGYAPLRKMIADDTLQECDAPAATISEKTGRIGGDVSRGCAVEGIGNGWCHAGIAVPASHSPC